MMGSEKSVKVLRLYVLCKMSAPPVTHPKMQAIIYDQTQQGGQQPHVLREYSRNDMLLENIRPCFGIECCIISLFCKFPDCISLESQNTACCTMNHLSCCQIPNTPGKCFVCFNINCELVNYEICLKSRSQVFCLDTRISFPPSLEVPCICNLFGLTLMYRNQYYCRCCDKLGNIEHDYAHQNVIR